MHPNFIGGNPYAVLGLDALAPYLGVTEANRGLISQGGLVGAPINPTFVPHPATHPGALLQHPYFSAQAGIHPLTGIHPALTHNPLLQQMIQRQAAAHYPQMVSHTPARKSGNSLGVNVQISLNAGVAGGVTGGYSAATFPAVGVAGSATQTLQSEFHGLKLSASASYSGYYTPSGGGAGVVVYGGQTSGSAQDIVLQGVFVGGFNAQPLPPGTGLTDGGVSLSGFPPNGLGNGIDMLPGKVGQVVKCPLLVLPSALTAISLSNTIPTGSTLFITTATVFLTFFGDNLQ